MRKFFNNNRQSKLVDFGFGGISVPGKSYIDIEDSRVNNRLVKSMKDITEVTKKTEAENVVIESHTESKADDILTKDQESDELIEDNKTESTADGKKKRKKRNGESTSISIGG